MLPQLHAMVLCVPCQRYQRALWRCDELKGYLEVRNTVSRLKRRLKREEERKTSQNSSRSWKRSRPFIRDVGYLRWHRHLPLHAASSPSFAAEARSLPPCSRNPRVKRLNLAPLSEQAHLLGNRPPLGTIGQRIRGLLTTCGRSLSRRARWDATSYTLVGLTCPFR